ncbi:MAG: hypothetical protein U0531_03510 [Dehalococcoidia bacterium]
MAWIVHLFASYLLVPMSCDYNTKLPLYAVTLVAALVTLVAGGLALTAWRRSGVRAATAIGGAGGRSGFLALVGVLISALFVALILAECVPNLYLNPCN